MQNEHSLFRRMTWHPAVAIVPTGLVIYRAMHRGLATLDYIAIAIGALWIGLSVYDLATNHRFLDWLYSGDRPADESSAEPSEADAENEQRATLWYEHKSKLMERALGKEHDMVMHAIIPYAIGGGLDLYYYPNGVTGTGIATKELSEMPNEGSSNRECKSYELVMFTRHPLDLDRAKDKTTPFGKAHSNVNQVLNVIARYSEQAKLNPCETCEFPAEMEGVGGKCFVLAGYAKYSDDLADRFGLLAIIEVHRSEMDFAREHGSAELFDRLKERGHFPYSDLEREPVA